MRPFTSTCPVRSEGSDPRWGEPEAKVVCAVLLNLLWRAEEAAAARLEVRRLTRAGGGGGCGGGSLGDEGSLGASGVWRWAGGCEDWRGGLGVRAGVAGVGQRGQGNPPWSVLGWLSESDSLNVVGP